MNKRQLPLLATTGALAIVLTVFYLLYLCGQSSFYLLDISSGWQPVYSYLGDRLRHGELPLWNPYLYSGYSQIALPSPTIFYPLTSLFAMLPFNQAFALMLILQQLAGGVGFFLLIRSFGWGNWAAALSATAFALSGQMFSLCVEPNLQGTICWFVFCWWSLRAIDSSRPQSKLLCTVLGALSVFLMIGAGVVEIWMPALVFLSAVALYQILQGARHRRRKRVVLCTLQLISIALGVLLSAVIILPAYEWSRISERALGLDLNVVFTWSCNWYDMLCLLVPQPLGDFFNPLNPFRRLVTPPPNYVSYISSEFLGPVVLTLAITGALDKTFKQRFLALGFTSLCLLVAMGSHWVPLVTFVSALKFTMYRYPVKAMAFVLCGIVLFACRGMNVLSSGRRTGAWMVATVIWSMLGLAGLIIFLAPIGQVSTAKFLLDVIKSVGRQLAIFAALGAATAVLCHTLTKQPKITARLCATVVAACAGLLLFNAYKYIQHPGAGDFYRRPSRLAELVKKSQSGTLPKIAVLYAQSVPPEELQAPEQTYQYARQVLAAPRNLGEKIDSVLYFSAGQTLENYQMWDAALTQQTQRGVSKALWNMCRIAGAPLAACQLQMIDQQTGARVPYPALDERYFQKILTKDKLNLVLYGVRDPLPRVYFAPCIAWGKPHEAVMRLVCRSDLSNFDPSQLVVLEHRDLNEKVPLIAVTPDDLKDSTATIAQDKIERIEINATTRVANYLVLADQYYPGWHAFIDGQRTTIYPADVLFRAVLVPAGTHHIEFRYEPESFKIGLLLSGTALVCVILLLIIAFLIHKRS